MSNNQKPIIEFTKTVFGDYWLVANDALSKAAKAGVTHEPHFYELARLVIGDSDNVVDLGANFGSHTIFLSKHCRLGKVFSFEPLGLTFSQLQLNVLANKCHNVWPYKFAVTDNTGTLLQMEPVLYSGEYLNIGATRVSGSAGGDSVLSLRLDDLSLPPIAFIKMDIQGSEYSALNGMGELIGRDRPLIFVEIEEPHLRACGSSSKQLIERFFSLDYVLYRIRTNYPCDHIALPKEKVQRLEERLIAGLQWELDKLSGTYIDLEFAEGGYNYTAFMVR